MKFVELNGLADKITEETGEYIGIGYTYNSFPSNTKEGYYTFYRESTLKIINFNSAQELRAHMENILNPAEDEGIDINDLADEDGLLRGAE